ncbi:hypothetical protein DSL72_006273 [Monilinia vaccinii-corymbosi]|uniref:Uncharacterized protein n=1 Tax=Monilinia vaccinii-corymbosi TaxID=61207 RepID=A0A8A3PLT8_9HELO|nr:hypothetical protein DSL72_006273 [Monilinia vaccinii-corymbosi]
MNPIEKIQEKHQNLLSKSPFEPHTSIAIQELTINLIGCAACTAIICKVLGICTTHIPEYIHFTGPVIIGHFVLMLSNFYGHVRRIFEEWRCEEDQRVRIKRLGVLGGRKADGHVGQDGGCLEVEREIRESEMLGGDWEVVGRGEKIIGVVLGRRR